MPELAEVEYYRRLWNVGLQQTIIAVSLHPTNRVFRTVPIHEFRCLLPGSMLIASETRGKQMLFRFSRNLWLGLHLGMTGRLRIEGPDFQPGKHDHLVLHQKRRALVFSDARQFGRVLFHQGRAAPSWWARLPPGLLSEAFTVETMSVFLHRHARLPIKAALLLQDGFPGVGNWMADEILWRAKVHPRIPGGGLRPEVLTRIWKKVRFVCAGAMRHVSADFSDPPRGWFYHERWEAGGRCPVHGIPLERGTIGGRTTAWCPKCQGESKVKTLLPRRH